jgi:hypothetical protein
LNVNENSLKNLRPNRKGRPKDTPTRDVRELARVYTAEAIERLVAWMRSEEARASVMASNLLLNRGWGKAEQPVTGDITHHIKRVLLDERSPN